MLVTSSLVSLTKNIPILFLFEYSFLPILFYKIMLILFRPFSNFSDLYNGISWESSFLNGDFKDNAVFLRNIEEMHLGIKEREHRHDNEGAANNDSDNADGNMVVENEDMI